jgi:flagellar motility protein MotE (MotC chaperone)
VLKDEFENGKIEAENKIKEAEKRNSDLDVKEAELKELKSQIDKLIASGNKEEFKAYYESIDAEKAEELYSQAIKEQQIDAKAKEFAQIYAEMDESAAAAIFEQLGEEKLDMISEILMAMSKKNSSAIIESMTPSFAAKVTEKLDELYKGN